MMDKQTIVKPILNIAGIPQNDKDIEVLQEMEDAISANPFFKMYHAAGLFPAMSSSRNQSVLNKQYMDQRIGEIMQSDVIIIHEQLLNSETAFDIGYASALNKPFIIVSDMKISVAFKELSHARLNTIEEIADYNFLIMKA